MSENKKNVPLIVALSIPVLMIVLITLSIYVPALFVKPQFDFIYGTGHNYCRDYRYAVQNERIIQLEIKDKNEKNSCPNNWTPRLFYYDVQNKTSQEITFKEAKKYRLDSRYKSPDGFEIVSGDRSFDIFFIGGSSYGDKFLKKGAYARRLDVKSRYYYDFIFLGWVKEGDHGQK